MLFLIPSLERPYNQGYIAGLNHGTDALNPYRESRLKRLAFDCGKAEGARRSLQLWLNAQPARARLNP